MSAWKNLNKQESQNRNDQCFLQGLLAVRKLKNQYTLTGRHSTQTNYAANHYRSVRQSDHITEEQWQMWAEQRDFVMTNEWSGTLNVMYTPKLVYGFSTFNESLFFFQCSEATFHGTTQRRRTRNTVSKTQAKTNASRWSIVHLSASKSMLGWGPIWRCKNQSLKSTLKSRLKPTIGSSKMSISNTISVVD
jgi:hypothetical protein